MVKEKGMQFFIINMKMKRKRDKKIDLPRRGFEPRFLARVRQDAQALQLLFFPVHFPLFS